MKRTSDLLRVLTLTGLLATWASPAAALWIHVEMKSVKNGSWTLLGGTFNHYDLVNCTAWGLGDPPAQYQNRAITVPDSTPLDELLLTDITFAAASGVPIGGPGTAPLFDDTMFPAPPGYQFATGSGDMFNIEFNTPLPTVGGPSMFELAGVFVSSQLNLTNPDEVLASVRLANGTTFRADVLSIPEPSTLALAGVAVASLVHVRLRRRRR
jgi:hypothetical protein